MEVLVIGIGYFINIIHYYILLELVYVIYFVSQVMI